MTTYEGAGVWEAGYADLAGESPVVGLSALPTRELPRAARFDGASRTFLQDEYGRLEDSHPVDQKVALALLVGLGKIPGAPGTGNGIITMEYVGGERWESEATEHMRAAVKDLVDAGDVRELALTVTSPRRGALVAAYDYVNLREPSGARRTRTVETG